MPEKEVKKVLALFLVLACALFMVGCGEEDLECDPPNVLINGTCCMDADDDSVCDLSGNRTGNVTDGTVMCGDGVCEGSENCSNCWQDCGACRKIVYVYVPRNYTLGELTSDIDELYRNGIRFRKDITALNEVSNFFYHRENTPRYFADFMDTKYKRLYSSRAILLNHIINANYYLNDSEDLLDYVDYSDWYIKYSIAKAEEKMYEERILSGDALEDYPTQPTGYQKSFRYEDWEYRNYTMDETVIADNNTVLENGMVESLYVGFTDYKITYKFHEYHDIDYETDEEVLKEDFRTVEERRMSNVHALSFICSRNLAVTLYTYDFDTENFERISEANLRNQIVENRKYLVRQAEKLKANCDMKYVRKVFVY